ncbi:hypothetical protein FHW88_003018 [Mucilaginibacter sp. SG538B]|nr:hypothetical protein [Mucilaginibacter sp. SG538B]
MAYNHLIIRNEVIANGKEALTGSPCKVGDCFVPRTDGSIRV